ncbi:MAG: EAL domain-containing protein, partial [Gammaproteobacteria bacterium]
VVLSINEFGAGSLGYEVDDVRGKLWYDLLDEPYRQLGRRRVGASIDKPGSVQYAELRIRLAGGGTRWLRVASRALESSFEIAEDSMRVLLVCQDISEARTLSEKLSYHATHDALTGLANRREFESRLRRALRRVGEPGRKYALCYLDLDQFKVVNDTCGHAAGDELLRRIALTLGERLRQRDTLARLGGDEFGILMENCEPAEAHRIANGLREAVAEFRFPWEGKSFSLGVSIGLVALGQDMVNLSQALRAADSACYVAKDLGRNRIHVYSENDTELDRRRGEIQWVERLQSALDEGRFRLAYQVIAPATSTTVDGVPADVSGGTAGSAAGEVTIIELLLRMLDEQGDTVHPRSFLAAAERYNLATPIDRWVTSNAFTWFATNRDALDKLDYCFINLSGRSLGDTGFLRFIREQLRAAELPPEKFCFEVTETAAISNLMDARRFMRALRGIGCSFALDDFGSGLSSFAYLKDLPVDFIKIDGVFSKDVEHNPVQRAMIKSINEVGHVMGKRTIAEWVETGPAIDTLRKIGVDYIQGYASGGPQPLESL